MYKKNWQIKKYYKFIEKIQKAQNPKNNQKHIINKNLKKSKKTYKNIIKENQKRINKTKSKKYINS